MLLNELKRLTLSELRQVYRAYLSNADFSPNTIQTATSDSFYIWRKASADVFWKVIESSTFENIAFVTLGELLPKQLDGTTNRNILGYMAHLRRFRRFALGDGASTNVKVTVKPQQKRKQMPKVNIPTPCEKEVEKYLKRWESMADYASQEAALDKLFFTFAPENTNIEDILLKVSTLNDFYSTNIFSVFPVAEHILSLNIDERLKQGHPDLVDDIKEVNGRNHYSFATKYCSHHNPLEYPIYDSYVDKILRHFRNVDGFCEFATDDLKEYSKFKMVILAFREYYGLTQYNLKEIDQYLWQLGKEYYPNNYGTKSKNT